MIEHYQVKVLMSLGSICIGSLLLLHKTKLALCMHLPVTPRKTKVLLQQQEYLSVAAAVLRRTTFNCSIMLTSLRKRTFAKIYPDIIHGNLYIGSALVPLPKSNVFINTVNCFLFP